MLSESTSVRTPDPDSQDKLDPTWRRYLERSDHRELMLLPQDIFKKMVWLERRRSERSRQRFVLMFLHVGQLMPMDRDGTILGGIVKTLAGATRETDLQGWYESDKVIGVICTAVGSGEIGSILSVLRSRADAGLRDNLAANHVQLIRVSFHVFPDDLNADNGKRASDTLYPDLIPPNAAGKASQVIKRVVDVVVSSAALLVLSPLLVAIGIAIRLTSKGPILFKQDRLGQRGVRFPFLKFRSMYVGSDPKLHRQYMARFIAGKHDSAAQDGRGEVYKIQDDPRVTSVGKWLRRTSLDELPQFFNVLKGEMSLVGPRPPIPYEVEKYQLWHRRRFFEVKPGLTGLWQVEGRSRTKFDDMVRLDLRYSRMWSLWLDLKILLKTPTAVVRGSGAF